MCNIKLTLQYDGTNFAGFELQPRKRTVRGEIERALQKIFKKYIKIVSSSRTDAGAHALGLVINFKVRSSIPTNRIAAALNSCLPEDIRVGKAQEVDESFNARFDTKSKEYQYLIYNGEILPPHLRNFVWQVKPKLNVSAMRRAAKILVGRHDFSSFCAVGGDDKDFVRKILKLDIRNSKLEIWQGHALGILRFRVIGNGFLYKMVRNMVGTLVEVGLGRTSLTEFRKILRAKDRRLAGKTAPAQGLCLVRLYTC